MRGLGLIPPWVTIALAGALAVAAPAAGVATVKWLMARGSITTLEAELVEAKAARDHNASNYAACRVNRAALEDGLARCNVRAKGYRTAADEAAARSAALAAEADALGARLSASEARLAAFTPAGATQCERTSDAIAAVRRELGQ